jgi:hypothetical protein
MFIIFYTDSGLGPGRTGKVRGRGPVSGPVPVLLMYLDVQFQ